jgi:ligand-binding sensor domain-containing protein
MLKARLFFIFCFTVSLLYTQQNKLSIETSSSAYSGWETYFSYNSIPSIAEGVNEIYFASYNSIFSYNIFNSQIEKFDTLNELSGDEISAFYHSENNNIIAIGYSSGFLQIINLNSNSIINIYDILNKPTIPADRKKINHFYQNEEDLLISTGYGISVYDINAFEFGDTYYIGDFASMLNISSTIVDENYIYASSPDLGIFRANLESNLIDFNSWQAIFTGNIYELLINENNILFYDDFNLMSIKNEEIITLLTLQNEIKNISINDSKIIIISEDNCIIYNNDLSQILNLFESETYMTIFNDGIIKNNKTYIATDEKGVLIIENSNNGFSYLKPDGPLENNIFSVETLNNHTWVSFGSYSEYFNPYPLKYSGVSSYDENLESWINITKDSISNQAVNLNNISINPFDNNNVFISSFHGGLIEMDNFNFTKLYDNNNSGLETLLTSDSDYESIRISDIEFDENGDLWVLNSRVDNPLKSFNLDNNSWNSYDFTEIINDGFQDELGFNDIEIDDYGNKWIASLRSGLIGFNNDSGNIRLRKVFSQDQSDMPSSYVKSIAVDNNNHLWIGTVQGLRVLYNTSNFFDTSVVTTQKIVILEDGIPRELLEQQYITDIEVDGANNKWVGTIGSGVFYFSANGQQTIYHFTKENSPLPSNNINDISVNSVNGKVYFATDRGLVSFNTGASSSSENFSTAFVYPNPVRPEFNTQLDKIKIKGLTENVNIKITDVAGNLVAEAQSNINSRYRNFNLEIDGGTAFWNGKNLTNQNVASGVYILMLSDLESYETKILKLMIIR